MATLISDYSEEIVASVPDDAIPPAAIVLGNITETQNDNGGSTPAGRSIVTLNWTLPTKNQATAESIGVKSGAGAEDMEGNYDPITGTPALYAMTDLAGAGKGDTTGSVVVGSKLLTVVATTNLSVSDWIQVKEGANEQWFKIDAINALVLTLHQPSLYTFTGSATVKEAAASLKTLTTQYTVDAATAVISLVNAQWSDGDIVVMDYATTLQDLDHLEIYRILGSSPVSDPTYANVIGFGGVVTVDNAVSSAATTKQDTLTDGQNGQTWTYYIFCVDDEGSANRSVADLVFVETITSIPENPILVDIGEQKVVLGWDAVSDTNFNGYNIYRVDGGTWISANAKKLNSALLSSPSFDDSAANVTNRVSAGTVPFPTNGSAFTYKIESQDTTTAWSTGTRNQSFGQAEIATASKSA